MSHGNTVLEGTKMIARHCQGSWKERLYSVRLLSQWQVLFTFWSGLEC